MKLGGSLRRTRGSGRKKTGAKARKGGSGRKKRKNAGGAGRLFAWTVLLAVGGWGLGYLIATQFVFPAAPPTAEMATVPDLRGLGLATVGERLAGVGLAMGAVDSLKHPSIPRDLVLGQSPLPGQLALLGTEVLVTRSLGPQMRSVPDVLRVDAERARIILETAGFVVQYDSVDAEIPRGRIVSTLPEQGAVVSIPAEMRLEVSRGPPQVSMPLVLGLEEAEALEILNSFGLVAGEVEEVFRFGRDQGIVVEQEPPADTPLERGSAVRLAVGRRGG